MTDVREGRHGNGRTALVVGGASGMGAATSHKLAVDGFDVAIGDVNDAAAGQLIGTIGPDHSMAVRLDATDRRSAERAIAAAMEKWDRPISVMIYCAGVLHRTRFADISADEWRLTMAVNLEGAFHVAQAALPGMTDLGWGRLVFFSSTAGKTVSTLGGAHYTVSKTALLGLSRAIAAEYAGKGITANAVCPGLIDTPMISTHATPSEVTGYESSFPIPRLGTPQEVAALVSFLVSEDAGYMTGAALDINGGDLMI